MKLSALLLRIGLGLVFAFWCVQVLAVAVFAVADRYTGATAVVMSLIVLVGGFAPVAFFLYLFRHHLPMPKPQPAADAPMPPTAAVEPAPAHEITAPRTTAPDPFAAPPPIEAISERELEVLALVARGLSNKEIAAQLSVTVGTVKTHTNNINRKLGTRTRTQAIARAREHGLL